MKKLKFDNRKDWLRWRHQGIGGSDVASLFNANPYKKPFKLFQEKLKKNPPKDDPKKQHIFDKGHSFEEKSLFYVKSEPSIKLGKVETDVCGEHPEIPCIRTSFDGYCEEDRVVIECKLVGLEDYNTVLAGEVIEKYKYQIQMQLMVSGFPKALLVVAHEDKGGEIQFAHVWIEADESLQENIEARAVSFMRDVSTNNFYEAVYLAERESFVNTDDEASSKVDYLYDLLSRRKKIDADIKKVQKELKDKYASKFNEDTVDTLRFSSNSAEDGRLPLRLRKVYRRGSIKKGLVENHLIQAGKADGLYGCYNDGTYAYTFDLF